MLGARTNSITHQLVLNFAVIAVCVTALPAPAAAAPPVRSVALTVGGSQQATDLDDLLEEARAALARHEQGLQLGFLEAAFEALQRAARLDADNAMVALLLARAHLAAGDPTAGIEALDRAVELGIGEAPERLYVEARLAGAAQDWERARRAWHAVRAAEDPPPDAALWLGWVEMRDERPRQALGWLAEAEATLRDARAAYYSALCYLMLDEPTAQRDALLRAVQRDPRMTSAWVMLARAEHGFGNLVGAREAARRAIEINPRETTPHRILGQLAIEESNFDAAAGHFADAVMLAPNDMGALAGLASAYFAAGRTSRSLQPPAEALRGLIDAEIKQSLRRGGLSAAFSYTWVALVRLDEGRLAEAGRLASSPPVGGWASGLATRALISFEAVDDDLAGHVRDALRADASEEMKSALQRLLEAREPTLPSTR